MRLSPKGTTGWNEETRGGMGTEEEEGISLANALHTNTQRHTPHTIAGSERFLGPRFSSTVS